MSKRRGRCGECDRYRRLVAFTETNPHGHRKWVCAPCRDRLTEAVTSLVDDRRRFAELANAARRRVEHDFDANVAAGRLATLLRSVAVRGASARARARSRTTPRMLGDPIRRLPP